MESDEPNLLSYLKFGSGSDCDQDSSSEDITFDLKESNQELKSDEEMAAEPLCDPKMGPIFMQLLQEW